MDTTSSYTLDVITRQDNNRTDICFGCLCNIKTDKLFVINSVAPTPIALPVNVAAIAVITFFLSILAPL